MDWCMQSGPMAPMMVALKVVERSSSMRSFCNENTIDIVIEWYER